MVGSGSGDRTTSDARGKDGAPLQPGVAVPAFYPWRRLFLALGTVAACMVLLYLRCPTAITYPQLWAEDGNVFYQGAVREGWAAFLVPYNGYYHLLPRLIAAVAVQVDPAWQPHVFVYGALFVTGLVVLRAFSRRLAWRHPVGMALAIVLVPHTGEVFYTPTNLQWITCLGLLMVLLMHDPAKPGEWAVDLATLVVAGLSGPFSVFAVPFFFLRACMRRSRASWILLGCVAAVGCLQAWTILQHPAGPSTAHPLGPFNFERAWQVFSARVPLAFFGSRVWVAQISPALEAVLGLLVLLLVGWLVMRRDALRSMCWTLFGYAGILLVVVFGRLRVDAWSYGEMASADRYFYVPNVLLAWSVISVVDLRSLRGRAAGVFLLVALACSAPSFRLPTPPDFQWARYVPALREGREVLVPINPGFRMLIPERETPWTDRSGSH